MVKLLEVISYGINEALNEDIEVREEGSGRNKAFVVYDTETGEELNRFTGRNASRLANDFAETERSTRVSGSNDTDSSSSDTETPRRPPAGTQMDLDGKTYEFRGRMWVEVNADGSYGRPAPRAVGNELNGLWEEVRGNPQGSPDDMESARTGNVDLDKNARYWTGSDNRHFVKIGSHAFRFESSAAAERFIEQYNEATRTNRQSIVDNVADRRLGAGGRAVNGWRAGNYNNLDEALERIPGIGPILQSRTMGFVFRVFEIFGWSAALLQSHVANCAYWKNQASEGEITEEEAEDLILSSQAALGAQITVLTLNMFRSVRRLRMFISGARVLTNMAAAIMAGTGVGLPGAIALIAARETGFFLIQWMLTSPAVQRKVAEWVASFLDYAIMRTIIESLAGITGQALAVASSALDNIGLGFDNLLRQGGWEYAPSDRETGEVYASTEWAKLVFQDVLFPPDRNFQVPYIPPGERRRLLQSTFASMYDLTFDESDAEGDANQELGTPENPRPVSSGQAGMLREYVFAYTPENYDRLKDTHEVVVLNDVMGQRPGGENQILLLMPTAQAISAGGVPQTDVPVITRSGQLIDRPEQEPTGGNSVDDIVNIASDAIDSADSVNSGGPGFRSGQ